MTKPRQVKNVRDLMDRFKAVVEAQERHQRAMREVAVIARNRNRARKNQAGSE